MMRGTPTPGLNLSRAGINLKTDHLWTTSWRHVILGQNLLNPLQERKGMGFFERAFHRVMGKKSENEQHDKVKQYFPEELTDSKKLQEVENKAKKNVLSLGQKLITLIENKGVVEEIFRVLDRFLLSLQLSDELVTEKSLAYLLHPTVISPGEVPLSLVEDFLEHLKTYLETLNTEIQGHSPENELESAPLRGNGGGGPRKWINIWLKSFVPWRSRRTMNDYILSR